MMHSLLLQLFPSCRFVQIRSPACCVQFIYIYYAPFTYVCVHAALYAASYVNIPHMNRLYKAPFFLTPTDAAQDPRWACKEAPSDEETWRHVAGVGDVASLSFPADGCKRCF